jgi:hypothetical protein
MAAVTVAEMHERGGRQQATAQGESHAGSAVARKLGREARERRDRCGAADPAMKW